jgi:hypothetical protein
MGGTEGGRWWFFIKEIPTAKWDFKYDFNEQIQSQTFLEELFIF